MEAEPEPDPPLEKSQTQTAVSRAEQLLQIRAPLIERGKQVPALERSIAAHEVEAKALYDLLRSANIAEKILREQLDEARREIEYARLDTDIVRERLRIAEAQLAEVRDQSHVKDVAHSEELNSLRKRCSAMKRKMDYLSTTQKQQLERRIMQLESERGHFRKQILEITDERDEWRETSISTRQQLVDIKSKHTRLQTVSALLETERTRSSTLQKQLNDAQQTAKKAGQKRTKVSVPDPANTKAEKALVAEKEKTAELRQKLKDVYTSTKKMKREETKMRQKCDDLERRLKDALARAVKSEERAAELEKRPATRSRGLASPGQYALLSPAPLTFGKRTAEDMASESKSRFTATLPQGIQDEGSSHDDEAEGPSPLPRKQEASPSSKRKKAKPQKLAPPTKTIAKRSAPRRGKTDSESLSRPGTKRRPANAKQANGPVVPGDSSTTSPAPGSVGSSMMLTPRRKHGKAPRKTTASSPAKRLKERPPEESASKEVPRRTLRSRRPVSYNYDEQGRDLVDSQPGFAVDYDALRPVRVTRSAKTQRSDAAAHLEYSEQSPSRSVTSPSTSKRPRRMETVRKQVQSTRGAIK